MIKSNSQTGFLKTIAKVAIQAPREVFGAAQTLLSGSEVPPQHAEVLEPWFCLYSNRPSLLTVAYIIPGTVICKVLSKI